MPPVILLTADRQDGLPPSPGPRVRPGRPRVWLGEAYVQAVRQVGGVPLLLPPGDAPVDALLDLADGVVLTGGYFDIHPSLYGEAVRGRLDRVEVDRTNLELGLARRAMERGVPVLGVCGGMQVLAVAAGGRLVQDIATDLDDADEHEQPTDPATPWHAVRIEAPASRWLGASVQANSTHHQAVRDPGAGLVACGWSDDGVVEVIAGTGPGFVLGVQWHPELLGELDAYRALIAAAS